MSGHKYRSMENWRIDAELARYRDKRMRLIIKRQGDTIRYKETMEKHGDRILRK